MSTTAIFSSYVFVDRFVDLSGLKQTAANAAVERRNNRSKARKYAKIAIENGTVLSTSSYTISYISLLFLISCQGYVPLTLDVVRVAFKVPLALHTPL